MNSDVCLLLQSISNIASYRLFNCYNKSMNIFEADRTAARINNAALIHGSQHRVEQWQQAEKLSSFHTQDLDIYNDSLKQRIERNTRQLKKLTALLKQNKLSPNLLQFTAVQCYYPSYILHHHFNHFLPLVEKYAPALAQQCRSLAVVGAVFDKTLNSSFQKESQLAKFIGNKILMNPKSHFYSNMTSIHLGICCFVAKEYQKEFLVFVRVRDQNGQLMPGVVMKDFGSTISGDFVSMAYRFDSVQPICSIPLSEAPFYKDIGISQQLDEIHFSLQDLMTSLRITVSYTSMRKQFSTYEKGKEERRIIEYQAVAGRIIDGFATLYMISFLRERMLQLPHLAAIIKPYAPVFHKLILKRLMELRECCGGFGFLQMSGHPPLIERACLKASETIPTGVPTLTQELQSSLLNPPSSSSEPVSLFTEISQNLFKNKQKIPESVYQREFFTQLCLQIMNKNLTLAPTHKLATFQLLHHYLLVTYTLDNARYLGSRDWKDQEVTGFVDRMLGKRNELLMALQGEIKEMAGTLDSHCSPHMIEGKGNQDQFYKKVYSASQNNQRNSQQFRKFVQQPLVDLIREQKAKL